MTDRIISRGFGVPNTTLPHHVLVRIPRNRTERVEIWEDFGAAAVGTSSRKICRALVPRKAWRQVATGIQSYLNQRLKKQKLKVSRFATGDHPVEPGLGHELCVLAWAMERATQEQAGIAFDRWSSHRSEELLWIFQQINKAGGEWDSPRTGWRKAVEHALIPDEQGQEQIDQQPGKTESKPVIRGFGVPSINFPHHFLVRIPEHRIASVEVWEDFGTCKDSKKLHRAVIPRKVWNKIKPDLQKHLNRRLVEKGFSRSSFSKPTNNTDTPVERILGRELCMLAWAVEGATPNEAEILFSHWSSYQPEELWWLFQQVDNDAGEWNSPIIGWRTAIHHAMVQDISGNPVPDLFAHLLKN